MEQRVTEEALLDGLGLEGKLGDAKATEIWAAAKTALARMPHLNASGITAAVQTALGQPQLEENVVMPIVERGRSIDPIAATHPNGKAPVGDAPLGQHLRRLSHHRRERPLAASARPAVRISQNDPAMAAVEGHRAHVAKNPPPLSKRKRVMLALIVTAGFATAATAAIVGWLSK